MTFTLQAKYVDHVSIVRSSRKHQARRWYNFGMDKLHQEIFINAPREKVWDTMLSRETYRAWTKPFNAGSDFKGEWVEGSKMLFIGTNDDGTPGGGMVSRIKEARRPEFVSTEHLV